MTFKEEAIASALLEAVSPAHRNKIWEELQGERELAAQELEQISEKHRAQGFVNEYQDCANRAANLRSGLAVLSY